MSSAVQISSAVATRAPHSSASAAAWSSGRAATATTRTSSRPSALRACIAPANPAPRTPTRSGTPARVYKKGAPFGAPSLETCRLGLDLVQRSIHQHDDGEVVAAALRVDRVAVRLPTGDARLVVDRVVVEPFVDRDDREQLIEGERDLRDRVLLLGGVVAGDGVVQDRVEVDRPARVGLRERVLHAAARRILVELTERPHQRGLRVWIPDAPGVQPDLELVVVHIRQLRRAD